MLFLPIVETLERINIFESSNCAYNRSVMLKKPFIISDKELWDKFVDGDKDAYKEIYERYFDELFNYGVRFSFDRFLVMDCIQDLFIDLYKYRLNLKRTEKIVPYLMISLKRKIARQNTQHKKEINLDIETLPFEYLLQEETIDESSTELNQQLVQNALNVLTARQREAIYLRYVVGLNYDELAVVMKLSYQASRTLIYRGIGKLRELLINQSIVLFSILFQPRRCLKSPYISGLCTSEN